MKKQRTRSEEKERNLTPIVVNRSNNLNINSTNKKDNQQNQYRDEKDHKINGLQKSTKNLLNNVK